MVGNFALEEAIGGAQGIGLHMTAKSDVELIGWVAAGLSTICQRNVKHL
jgi:hypothetical protein